MVSGVVPPQGRAALKEMVQGLDPGMRRGQAPKRQAALLPGPTAVGPEDPAVMVAVVLPAVALGGHTGRRAAGGPHPGVHAYRVAPCGRPRLLHRRGGTVPRATFARRVPEIYGLGPADRPGPRASPVALLRQRLRSPSHRDSSVKEASVAGSGSTNVPGCRLFDETHSRG